ncbi:MAG: hypothetical protein AXA67_06980 [Methylothermaceae bacteria B42]|nr:MAG: hypothetical protein AXA67_06980 [Methylothermaceae bacteria B42]HHJ40231.1 type II toxin-antitoxin system Phd/YefM family antitoxin [Methylothermaceae bacterium]
MSILSSREFNHHPSKAKQAAEKGPVIITDRGRPTHVLLTWESYQRMAGGQTSLLDAIVPEETEEYVEFEPPRHEGGFHKSAVLENGD